MGRKRTATVNFTLRLREDLRRQIEASAKKEERSLNEEMVQRLEESFRRETAAELMGKAQWLLDENGKRLDKAELIREEAISEIAEIKKAVIAGRPATEIFPNNALITTKYGTHAHLREMNE